MNLSEKQTGLWNHPILWVVRILLAGIMLYAAVPKFFDWEAVPKILDFAPFARSIYNYRMVPVETVHLIAMMVAPLELLGGLTLLTGIWLRAGSLSLALLQAVFIVGVAQAFYRDLDISCGCFAGFDTKVGWTPLIRDSFFLAGFVLVYLSTFRQADSASPSSDEPVQSEGAEPPPSGD